MISGIIGGDSKIEVMQSSWLQMSAGEFCMTNGWDWELSSYISYVFYC